MSRITRCPSCETLFKVVPDQLRLSQGWVRCGSCGTVFDAGAQMQHAEARSLSAPDQDDEGASHSAWSLLLDDEERPEKTARRAVPDASVSESKVTEYGESPVQKTDDAGRYSHEIIESDEPVETTTVVLTNASFALPASEPQPAEPAAREVQEAAMQMLVDEPLAPPPPGVDFLISQLDADIGAADGNASPTQAEREAHGRDIASNIIRRRKPNPGGSEAGSEMPILVRASVDAAPAMPPADAAPDKPAPAPSPARAEPRPAPSQDKPRQPRPDKPAEPAVPAAPAEPQEDVPSFMRDAQRRRFWRQPWVRVGMALAVLALLALLGLRWVHDKRDWLAAAYPDARPGLNAFCNVLGCEIKPFRMLDAVAIEGSSFNRLASGAFQLHLSLRNTERLEVATPSLALSLTDAQDQVVFERVIHPRDVQAPAVLLPHRDWSGGLTLTLDPQLSSQVAGYRVLAFYP